MPHTSMVMSWSAQEEPSITGPLRSPKERPRTPSKVISMPLESYSSASFLVTCLTLRANTKLDWRTFTRICTMILTNSGHLIHLWMLISAFQAILRDCLKAWLRKTQQKEWPSQRLRSRNGTMVLFWQPTNWKLPLGLLPLGNENLVNLFLNHKALLTFYKDQRNCLNLFGLCQIEDWSIKAL